MNSRRPRLTHFVLRAGICTIVVLGQLVGAFGWASSASLKPKHKGTCTARLCGCIVTDSESCCCSQPAAEPTPSCCKPKKSCCDSSTTRGCCEKPKPVVTAAKVAKGKDWLRLMARPCQQELPPSNVLSDPESPPAPSDSFMNLYGPTGRLVPVSDHFNGPLVDPPIPPPRLA